MQCFQNLYWASASVLPPQSSSALYRPKRDFHFVSFVVSSVPQDFSNVKNVP